MDYSTLKNLKTSDFEKAADGYRAVSDMASAAKDALEQRISAKMRKSLSGSAADAALKQLRELAKDFHYTQVECGVLSTALNALAADLQSAKSKLDAAVADADGEKLTVEKNGSVTYPEGGDKYEGKTPPGGTVNGVTDQTAKALHRQAAHIHPNPYFARALACADRIAAALEEATEADEKWAPKLRKLKADDDLTVSAADWVDAKKDTGGVRDGAERYLDAIKAPPKHGDPEDNAEWWKHLSADERDAYISMRPASIGAMNGLPADARDEANRTVLAETRGQYEMRLAALNKSEPPEFEEVGARGDMKYSQKWLDWHHKKERLEGKIKGMQAIQGRFDRTGQGGLPRRTYWALTLTARVTEKLFSPTEIQIRQITQPSTYLALRQTFRQSGTTMATRLRISSAAKGFGVRADVSLRGKRSPPSPGSITTRRTTC